MVKKWLLCQQEVGAVAAGVEVVVVEFSKDRNRQNWVQLVGVAAEAEGAEVEAGVAVVPTAAMEEAVAVVGAGRLKVVAEAGPEAARVAL